MTCVPFQSDFRAAFRNAVDHAQFEDGHSGYTGTIASKYDVMAFPTTLQDLGGCPLDQVIQALEGDETACAALLSTHPELSRELQGAQAAYDDKYGHTVAFRHGDELIMCGFAPE